MVFCNTLSQKLLQQRNTAEVGNIERVTENLTVKTDKQAGAQQPFTQILMYAIYLRNLVFLSMLCSSSLTVSVVNA